MRVSQRLIAAAVVVALSGALAGCGGGGLSNFDPTDLLDFLDTKKKMPGDRKPVFPEGVPGLEQGVPRDLYKGSSQEQIDRQNAAVAVAPPAEEPKSKQAAKSRGKKATPAANASTAPAEAPQPAAAADSNAAPDPNAAPEGENTTAGAPPPPKPKKIVRKRTTAPPPDQQATQPAAPAQQQSASPFPAPLPSGTLQR
jgi:hypothetical protein